MSLVITPWFGLAEPCRVFPTRVADQLRPYMDSSGDIDEDDMPLLAVSDINPDMLEVIEVRLLYIWMKGNAISNQGTCSGHR